MDVCDVGAAACAVLAGTLTNEAAARARISNRRLRAETRAIPKPPREQVVLIAGARNGSTSDPLSLSISRCFYISGSDLANSPANARCNVYFTKASVIADELNGIDTGVTTPEIPPDTACRPKPSGETRVIYLTGYGDQPNAM